MRSRTIRPLNSDRFADRRDAGRRLARQVHDLHTVEPVVIALPTGGVPVAAEVAASLDAPLQVLPVRKLAAPLNPGLALGAIAEEARIVDPEVTAVLGLSNSDLEEIVERERAVLDHESSAYRGDGPPLDLRGRTVVVVDEGAATGLPIAAAIRGIRRQDAAGVIAALPVCSPEALELLHREADQVAYLQAPEPFLGVAERYREFSRVTPQEALDDLRQPRRAVA